jgi:hypothetical protein
VYVKLETVLIYIFSNIAAALTALICDRDDDS